MSKYSTCLTENLFIQPDKGLTVVNSDNATSVQLLEPNNEDKLYSNQILAGNAHPRTKIAPIVPARSMDIDYWKDTPLTTLSMINRKKPQYPSLAGYNTQELVDYECLGCPNSRQTISKTKASPLVQTIQPGVYDFPTDYQPIIDSEGIADVPQFEPIKQIHDRGNVMFVGQGSEQDHGNSKPKIPKSNSNKGTMEHYEPITNGENDVSLYNVYDPRFNGYGSDNRSYLDPMLHQTRYYYDDVDAIRRPNYIVRSKIDSCITGFGDQYGPMQNVQLSLNQTRPLAEKAYLDNNLNYRNDLMQTLMSKRNAEIWQNRKAPKYTTRQGLK